MIFLKTRQAFFWPSEFGIRQRCRSLDELSWVGRTTIRDAFEQVVKLMVEVSAIEMSILKNEQRLNIINLNIEKMLSSHKNSCSVLS